MTDQDLRRRLERVLHHLDLAHRRLLGDDTTTDPIVGAAIQVAIATIELENLKLHLAPDLDPIDELFA